MAGLTGEIEGDLGRFGVRSPGAETRRPTGQVEHPALQHLRIPGEAVPAAEGAPPEQGQPQGFDRAAFAHGEQVAQPVEPVQGHGEAPTGIGSVPGIALGSGVQGDAGEGEVAQQDSSAILGLARTGVWGRSGQALGPRPGQHPAVQGRAGPFPAGLPTQADRQRQQGDLTRQPPGRRRRGRLSGHGRPAHPPRRAAMLAA